MKMFLGLLIVFLAFTLVCTPGQTNSTWQHYFTTNVAADSVAGYALYVEVKTANSGWIMQDGMDYTTALDGFNLTADKPHTAPGVEITHNQVFTNSGQWFRFAVIAYTLTGTKSVLSVSQSYKVDKRPTKPGGVGSRKL